MSVRALIAEEITRRVRAVDTALTQSVWGARAVSVLIERLEVGADGALSGRVRALLIAQTLDEIALAELVPTLAAPMAVRTPGLMSLLLSLQAVEESLDESSALLSVIYTVRGRIEPQAMSADCTAELVYQSAYASVAPWIGAAHEPMYRRIDGDAPEVGERSIEELLP